MLENQKSKRPARKKPPQFAKRKKAFDEVMEKYRAVLGFGLGEVGAVNISSGGKSSPNFVRPVPTEFRCDVEKVIEKCVTTPGDMERFEMAYVRYDSDNPIEMEVRAQAIMGSMRHGLEQGIGALFIDRGIYPIAGSYFLTVRQPRGRV